MTSVSATARQQALQARALRALAGGVSSNTRLLNPHLIVERAAGCRIWDAGGTEYIDNQRRAELLFQQLLTNYPQSDKIDDAAYQLGDIYESKAYKQYRRAAWYFERCVQWNTNTQFDARLRAGRAAQDRRPHRPGA